jgi:hypothetical protein
LSAEDSVAPTGDAVLRVAKRAARAKKFLDFMVNAL